MPRFILDIALDDDAFADTAASELGRVLVNAAGRIDDGECALPGDRITLRDANGNSVGTARIEESR